MIAASTANAHQAGFSFNEEEIHENEDSKEKSQRQAP